MSLLSRHSSRAIPVLILAAVTLLLALPVSWSARAPGSAIAPTLACAGGSPDETLAPHKTANAVTLTKTAVSVPSRSTNITISPITTQSRQFVYQNAVSARYLWTVLWRVSVTLAVKF